jgi:hypothetical protein
VPWCPQCGVEYREGFVRCSDCGVALVHVPPAPNRQPGYGGNGEPNPDTTWLTAGVFTTPEEAGIARGFLHAAGIQAEIVDKEMHIGPYGMNLLGEVFLRVRPADLDRAKRLLGEAERGHVTLPEGADTGQEEAE